MAACLSDLGDLIEQATIYRNLIESELAALQAIFNQPASTWLSQLTAIQTRLSDLREKLQEIITLLNAYLTVLLDPNAATPQQRQDALACFKISLTDAAVGSSEGWGKGSGIRVLEAYTAVYKIIQAIARGLAAGSPINDDHQLKGILQFIDSFGETELRIVAGNNPDAPATYAITNPNGLVIALYNDPIPLLETDTAAGRDYPLHTAQNLVHEFGHILDFRSGSLMYSTEWQKMRKEFGNLVNCGLDGSGNPIFIGSLARGFGIGEGWNLAFRQNKLDITAFTGCSDPSDVQICQLLPVKDELCLELEIERIADMFLFWVYADTPEYAFTSDDRGQALNVFANGGLWSRGTTSLTLIGFMGWINNGVS